MFNPKDPLVLARKRVDDVCKRLVNVFETTACDAVIFRRMKMFKAPWLNDCMPADERPNLGG